MNEAYIHFALEALEPRLLLSAATLDAATRAFRFDDASGDQVMVRWSGRGSAQMTLDEDAADNADTNSIIL